MADHKKLYSHEETTVSRDNDGRTTVTTKEKKFSIKVSQDDFYMVYFRKLRGFYELTSAIDIKILAYLCENAEYNHGTVDLSTKMRDDICKLMDILPSQISRSISSLKIKMLISADKDRIQINPACFWKGGNDARNSLISSKDLNLKMTFCIDCQDDLFFEKVRQNEIEEIKKKEQRKAIREANKLKKLTTQSVL